MFDAAPEILELTATMYGVGAAATSLFQARQMLRSGRSCDVSARFFAAYAGGYGIWLLYGLSIQSVPLILVDAFGLLCGGATLMITLALRGSLLRPRTWSGCDAGESLAGIPVAGEELAAVLEQPDQLEVAGSLR